MTQFSISFDGLDKIYSMLDPKKFQQAIDDGVQESAQMLRDLTKTLPPVSAPKDGWDAQGLPVDTGRMRQAIVAQKTALFGAVVLADTDYSGMVAYGTSKMPGRDFFLYALQNFGGLDKIQIIMNTALEKGMAA